MVDVVVSSAGGKVLMAGVGSFDLPYAFVCRKGEDGLGIVTDGIHVAGGAPISMKASWRAVRVSGL